MLGSPPSGGGRGPGARPRAMAPRAPSGRGDERTAVAPRPLAGRLNYFIKFTRKDQTLIPRVLKLESDFLGF